MREIKVVGEIIFLRPMEMADAKIIKSHVTKNLIRWTANIPFPYTLKAGENFIKKSHEDISRNRCYALGIILNKTDKLVGTVGLNHISPQNKSAELGYWLGEDYWGKGIVSEAVQLMLKFGFEELKLHRIHAKTMAPNKASIRIMEKLGFVKEGIKREAVFREDKWHDFILYGMLKSDYEKIKGK